jgi:sugar phosphate isomerase/epimerase
VTNIGVGLSMLHSLGQPFSVLCQKLRTTRVRRVELVDDGLHALAKDRIETLREIRDTQSLSFTLHSPFANINIAAPAVDMRRFILRRVEKSMIFARQLECALMIFHPGLRTGISSFYPGVDWRTNIASVRTLLALSTKYGVDLAIENVPKPYGFLVRGVEQFTRFLEELNEEIGVAFDVGHSNINGDTHEFLSILGRKVVHVHAHDNDGEHDLHLGVGRGTVNWTAFATDLKKTGFTGTVMVESYSDVNESVAVLERLLP